MLTTPEGTLDYDLECLATGNLLPTIKWFKGGAEVTDIPNSEIDLVSSSNATFIYNKLVFKSVQPTVYGNWTCEASNLNSGDILKTDSANTLLVVQCKLLIFLMQIVGKHYKHFDHVMFNIDFQFLPQCGINWLIDSFFSAS